MLPPPKYAYISYMLLVANTTKKEFQEILFSIMYITENLMMVYHGIGSRSNENYNLLILLCYLLR